MNIQKTLLIWTALFFSSLAMGHDIFTAVKKGETEKLAKFLEKGSDPNLKNQQGWTLLHIASISGHLDAVSLLLDKGAKITATAQHGLTPLFWAIFFNNQEVSSLLEERGARLTTLDNLMFSELAFLTTIGNHKLPPGITLDDIKQAQITIKEVNNQSFPQAESPPDETKKSKLAEKSCQSSFKTNT